MQSGSKEYYRREAEQYLVAVSSEESRPGGTACCAALASQEIRVLIQTLGRLYFSVAGVTLGRNRLASLGSFGVTDTLTPEQRSANMSKVRGKHTLPEMIVRRIVHGLGFRYRLHVPGLPGKPDLVFHRLHKIVEVRGCFWHQHKGCSRSRMPSTHVEFWHLKLARNKMRDRRNERRLRADGWDILTVWGCETEDRDLRPLTLRLLRFLQDV
jgi:DNA mismatch endonuclease (patch repair protein)